ncbi:MULTISPECIES: FHA domain-containing protein [unclassified Synechococcus]|uniref:FHA domain-containing protein n=1 Tax=unclassified Synechococcus TaxID=2626047 RepID=UPI0018CEC519|nr:MULTISPECIES: FHA domain-containing protein [unclassified Synechococcus]MEA5421586.1 FHA domain-containing protein [Synechococcus sp. CCY9202]QPN66887.1 FHA domain-containing protein [Synechococcus sp. CBW1006]
MTNPAPAPPHARLVQQNDPGSSVPLDSGRPLSIGRDPANQLCLPNAAGLSRRHAEIRSSSDNTGWVIADLGSANGTYVGRQRITAPHPLQDGDRIQLGRNGPVFLFQWESATAQQSSASSATGSQATAATTTASKTTASKSTSGKARAARPAPQPAVAAQAAGSAPAEIDIGGERISLDRIRSAELRSLALHPHIFSWWVLVCLGGLLLLPFPLVFWPLQVAALAGAVLLGSRKQHVLVVVLRDGLAYRRSFSNRITALSHRNGIRRALGQTVEP